MEYNIPHGSENLLNPLVWVIQLYNPKGIFCKLKIVNRLREQYYDVVVFKILMKIWFSKHIYFVIYIDDILCIFIYF